MLNAACLLMAIVLIIESKENIVVILCYHETLVMSDICHNWCSVIADEVYSLNSIYIY